MKKPKHNCTKIKNVSEEKLITAIQKHIKSKYPKSRLEYSIYCKWKVGVTNNIERRYKENLPKQTAKLAYWECWDAGTADRALKVEKCFCTKGLSRCSSTGLEAKDSKYIYIFRIPDSSLNK